MRKAKKLLAILLTILTLISSMPLSVLADEADAAGKDPPVVLDIEQAGEAVEPEDVPEQGESPPPASTNEITPISDDVDLPTEEPGDTPTPDVTEDPTETSEVTVDPTEVPEATAEPTATPEATAEPTETPEATAEPTETPEATTEPTEAPEATAEPTATPEVTAEPTEAPEATAEPTEAPEATTEPTATPEATAEPTATPEPSATPTPSPTPEPVEDPYVGTYKVLDESDIGANHAWPVPGAYTITQGFGNGHGGWDIGASMGDPVAAADAGTVVTTQVWNGIVTENDDNSYGHMVLLRHEDGTMTRYAHLSEINVREGHEVVMGQQIGRVGSTGNSTGPHLHFEVIQNGERVNPSVFGYYEHGIIAPKDEEQEEEKPTSAEEYILKHANPSYVGTGDKLKPYDFMRVAYSLADRSYFDHAPTLNDLWQTDEDGDGISDNWMAALGQYEAYSLLFELSPDSNYYVARADAGFSNATISDWVAGNSDAGLGVLYDDIIFDEAAGLVYVPKYYTTADTDQAEGLGHVRLQILYTVGNVQDFSKLETEISLTVNTEQNGKTTEKTKIAEVSALSSSVEVTLGKNKQIDSVAVNGVELDDSDYDYESSSGTLVLHQTAATIDTIDVDATNTSKIATIASITDAKIKGVLDSAFGENGNNLNSLGTWGFDGVPVEGSAYLIPAKAGYYPPSYVDYGRSNFVKPCLDAYPAGSGLGTTQAPESLGEYLFENTWRVEAATQESFDWGGWSPNAMVSVGKTMGIERYVTVQEQHGVKIKPVSTKVSNSTASTVNITDLPHMNIDLFCAHLGISNTYDDYSPNYWDHNKNLEESTSVTNDDPLFTRFLYVDEKEGVAVVSLGVATVNSQAGVGYFKLEFDSQRDVTFTKKSAQLSITSSSSAYSLKGAEYGIYNTRADARNDNNRVKKITTNASGKATINGLQKKTYFVKELKAPKGFKADDTIYELDADATSMEVEDDPAMLRLTVIKKDSRTNKPLQGAVFQITKADGTTQRVTVSSASGTLSIHNLPLGTTKLKEISAPEGYTLDPTEHTYNFEANDSEQADYELEYVDREVTIDNAPIRGGVQIQKVDSLSGSTPQGGASLSGIAFTVRLKSAAVGTSVDVQQGVNGLITSGRKSFTNDSGTKFYTYNNGDDVLTITTNASGIAKTGQRVLPAGTYTIREVSANGSMRVGDGKEQEFTISVDGDIVGDGTGDGDRLTLTAKNDVKRGGVEVQKHVEESGSTPQGSSSLAGIVFTIQNTSTRAVYIKEGTPGLITSGKRPESLNGGNWYKYDPNEDILTITTDASGVAKTSSNDVLPYGRYTVRETATNDTLLKTDGAVLPISVTTDNTAVKERYDTREALVFTNEVKRGGVQIQKDDAQNGSTPQGDASLAGIVMTIKTTSSNPVYLPEGTPGLITAGKSTVVYKDKTYYKSTTGEDVLGIVTDASGVAKTGTNVLPVGTYTVRETAGNSSMLLSDASEHAFEVKQSDYNTFVTHGTSGDDLTYGLIIKDEPVRGGVQIQKDDAQTGNTPQGNASLAGIVFTVKNTSTQPVYVKEGTPGLITAGKRAENIGGTNYYKYNNGEDILTITTDENGAAKTANDVLPYGSYAVRETLNGTTNTTYVITDGQELSFTVRENLTPVPTSHFTNQPKRVPVKIFKVDADSGKPDPEGDASNITSIEIYNKSTHDITYDVNGNGEYEGNERFAPNAKIVTLTTGGADNSATSRGLPIGSYMYKEVQTGNGYALSDPSEHLFEITDSDHVSYASSAKPLNESSPLRNTVYHGGVQIQKNDADRKAGTSQGDGSLKGIKFVVTNKSAKPVYVSGTQWTGGAQTEGVLKSGVGKQSYAVDEDILVIVTDDKGVAKTSANNVLPYGTYEIREVRMDWTPGNEGKSDQANDSYLWSSANVHTFRILEDGKCVVLDANDNNGASFTAENDVIRGKVVLEKRDADTRKKEALGGATLEGTVFAIVNKSALSVLVDVDGDGHPEEYAPDHEILRITTDANGDASTDDILPIGTYEITEVKASKGYKLTDDKPREFKITAEVRTVSYKGEPTPAKTDKDLDGAWFNHVIRGDLKFVKVRDSDGHRLEGIPFLVTSQTTGESHVLVSDENGDVSTEASWNLHTTNTNINDSRYDATINGWKEDPDYRAGVWFSGVKGAGGADPDDEVGALPYDKYTIQELPNYIDVEDLDPKLVVVGDGNDGMRFWTDVLTVNRDGHVLDEGTVRNKPRPVVQMWTTAKSSTGDEQLVYGYEKTTLIDTVEVVADQGLAGLKLRLDGVLMDKATGDPVLIDGKQVTASKTFTPHGNVFTEDMEFTFDARELDGHDVVVYERLYEVQDEFLHASHEDIEDEGQTVHIIVPGLDSSAYGGEENPDVETRTKTVYPDTDTTITDEVYLSGLIEGQEYRLISVIIKDSYDGTVPDCAVFDGLTIEEHVANGTMDRVEAMMEAFFEDLGIPYRSDYTNPTTKMWFDLPVEVDTRALERLENRYSDLFAITAWDTQTFTAHAEDGTYAATPRTVSMTVTTTFEHLNTIAKSGQKLRCFQILVAEDRYIIATEVVSEYAAETVSVLQPEIGTTATVEGEHTADALDTITLDDVVEYSNLAPGKEYKITGVLMDKATGEPLRVDGKQITAETTFVPETPNGTVTVTFTFNGSALAGKEIVAFEDLYRDDYQLAAHADINDEGQTVRVRKPDIGTTATADGAKEVDPLDEINLVDTVEYHDLTPGKEYKVTGVLMDKETDEPLLVDGKQITAETTFSPNKEEGSVTLSFTFDARGLNSSSIVAFETLRRNGKELAVHADINDMDQTVEFRNPEIGTTATVEGQKDVDR